MPIDVRLLTLTQWLSPAYPVGAFAFSHGLEQAIREGRITTPAGLEGWLRDLLTDGSVRSDAILLRLACRGDPAEADAVARAFTASSERLREAQRQGAAFVRTTNAVWSLDLPPLLLPVAVGAAAQAAGLDEDAAALLYLQSVLGNLVSAALRLMPLGQTEGQRIVAALQDDCAAVAEATRDATADDLSSATFLSDIASMRHETLEPRMFQS